VTREGTVLDALVGTLDIPDDVDRHGAQSPALSVRDEAALEEAYRQHATAVFRFAMRCVSRRDLAEDLTSEAFLALQRNLGRVEMGQLPSWLFRVVKNRAIDCWRRERVERRYALYAEPPPPVQPLEPAPPVPRRLLESRALKPIHRLCLQLRYVQGLSRVEVATRLGLSETQVKGHLQYARELLRKELEGRAE
jgi:RNA polymerase sigma-70 factor, ECF subfamily